MINEEAKQIFRNAKEGQEEFTILHTAAKCCRIILCLSLIQEFKFGNYYPLKK
jgi:hypothetical protein